MTRWLTGVLLVLSCQFGPKPCDPDQRSFAQCGAELSCRWVSGKCGEADLTGVCEPRCTTDADCRPGSQCIALAFACSPDAVALKFCR